MKNRYKLPIGLQKSYLLEVERATGLTGDDLAKKLGVVGRTYRDWKTEKNSISEIAVDLIEKIYGLNLPFSKEEALRIWKEKKLDAWRKGGLALSAKYGGPGTRAGRIKGGKRAMALLRLRGLVPAAKPFKSPKGYSVDLAEFTGILLGDGHIGKDQWSITLNSIADKEYLKFVTDLVVKLFGFKPGVHFRKDCNAVVIIGSGILSIKYLKSIGLKQGNKIKLQVRVPSWIKTNPQFSTACLRGLVDTDGGIFVHKYKVKGKEYRYLKLNFVNRSMPLLDFVYWELLKLGFTPKLISAVENKRVWLYNQQEVRRYLEIVGTNNPRLLKYT